MEMTKNIFRICTILALGAAALQTTLSAQNNHTMTGVWDLTVTVVNCSDGTPIRIVHSLQLFVADGSLSETANIASRGSSVGTWSREGGRMYSSNYWFYRYTPAGTFASQAEGLNAIELSKDGNHFTAKGTVQDRDATGVLLSTGCVSQIATRINAH
jgi:hypothetical protein